MRIAICDDEQEQRKLLFEYIRRYKDTIKVDIYGAALDLLLAVDQIKYDIVFMDIEMPSPNGFEVAEALKKKKHSPLVIFVTKSHSYTIQGYGIAFRYLPKPISYEMFESTLSLAIKECEPEKIPFMSEGTLHVLSTNEITYCESLDHNLTVHTTTKNYTSRTSLAEISTQLSSEDFAQPHKSFFVNLKYVQSVDTNNITLSWRNTTITLPLSKGKRKQFIQKLGDYIGR